MKPFPSHQIETALGPVMLMATGPLIRASNDAAMNGVPRLKFIEHHGKSYKVTCWWTIDREHQTLTLNPAAGDSIYEADKLSVRAGDVAQLRIHNNIRGAIHNFLFDTKDGAQFLIDAQIIAVRNLLEGAASALATAEAEADRRRARYSELRTAYEETCERFGIKP